MENGKLLMNNDHWLLYKYGRGFFRPNFQGYTNSVYIAGRYGGKTVWDYVQSSCERQDKKDEYPNIKIKLDICFYSLDYARKIMLNEQDKLLFNLSDEIEKLKQKLSISESALSWANEPICY